MEFFEFLPEKRTLNGLNITYNKTDLTIQIKFKFKTRFLAIQLLEIIFEDPYSGNKKIKINNNFLDIKEINDFFINSLNEENEILLFIENINFLNYEMSCILYYSIDDNDYFMYEQLHK